ncbi:sigma-70 family RNA polymerase sigma factor [Arthrobacter sp. efr-133-TYG-104]|uniref:sigma-70 family RNA polymerase sigma factor n=1 Tax=Arthrobacter sp. efr-133-TYG-104 TaxID=3040324 RepID=UPI0025511D02|nr:sigma-70 family RNA polymerase sigma factor [Arthrobacter sp. efr-133-TYG-104]
MSPLISTSAASSLKPMFDTPRPGESPVPNSRTEDEVGAGAGSDDAGLIALVREGDHEAFAELYRRHRKVAGYVARAESDSSSEAEDVVSEAFAAVFAALTSGKGPRESFQAYLATTVRRMAHRRNVTVRRSATLGYGSALDVLTLEENTTIAAFESTILMRAFRSLPVRWQTVLWCMEVEGLKPAATARVLDLTPNGVSSLLIRATEGLRQAYLQQHVGKAAIEECTDFARHLGKFVRNAVHKAARLRVDEHVAQCRHCANALADLQHIQAGMNPQPRVVVPAALAR